MNSHSKWGIVSTIKAPTDRILNFAAWHLDQGAAHIFIYLDDHAPAAQARLDGHPAITAIRTDDAHWMARLGRVPPKHQLRQGRNAEHAYAQLKTTDNDLAAGLDWLAHIDVDEFLISDRPIDQVLAALPNEVRAARSRPQEVLSNPDGSTNHEILCKAWLPPNQRSIVPSLYPTYGKHFRGGFLSHVAGKIFARTGQPDIGFRIHDIFEQGGRIASQDLPQVALLHDHASDWSHWLAAYRYRHTKGSYRSELKGALAPDQGGLTPHQLLHQLEQTQGETGLRHFFEEMCVATPGLKQALAEQGLLRHYSIDFAALRHRYFPV